MFALLIALVAPAFAISPAGAAWSSAGVGAGAGATMFVPGVMTYTYAYDALDARDCTPALECEGLGAALLVHGVVDAGSLTYGLTAATAGASMHAITVGEGGWTVFAAGGATSAVAYGMTQLGMELATNDQPELGVSLAAAGLLGQAVGVPLAVGLASGGVARSAQESRHLQVVERSRPQVTGLGVAPTTGGGMVQVSLSF